MAWNFRLNFLVLLTKLARKHFGTLKFKIYGFYVKYNTRLKYSNTAAFLLCNYLFKCAQHMLDVLSTENLSIHLKIPIGLKNPFDLHKLLYFFHESKTCTLRLVFLLMFFSEGWRNKYFEDWRGRISCKTFSVKWSWQPLRRLGLISNKPFSHENNLMFQMFCRHFLLSQTFTSSI